MGPINMLIYRTQKYCYYVCSLEIVAKVDREHMVLDAVVVEGPCTLAINVYQASVIVETSIILLIECNASTKSDSHVKWFDVVAVFIVDVCNS